MKKKIYKVWQEQIFISYKIKKYGFLYRKSKKISFVEELKSPFYKYVLADTEEQAIQKYKNKYNWDVQKPICDFWNLCMNECNSKFIDTNTEFLNTIKAKEHISSFDILKKEMNSNDFLEYCKQELFPIEVIRIEDLQ